MMCLNDSATATQTMIAHTYLLTRLTCAKAHRVATAGMTLEYATNVPCIVIYCFA